VIDLEELVPLMSALASREERDPDRVSAVKRGIVASLGEEIARELCDGALSTSEIASRFFRLRARMRIEDALKNNRR
jgi:hypothetical protein